ncbi:MAG: hypothetical protein RAO94_02910 [Candidatus Stygibacter australis]|nr:hypothetical protein [Candidatus Stygibacter australis]MDP8321284.1 hypothetical protein [Candidatus Stygibacter australis]
MIPINEPGEYKLLFNQISYKPQTIELNFTDLMESKIINIDLVREAVEIEGGIGYFGSVAGEDFYTKVTK